MSIPSQISKNGHQHKPADSKSRFLESDFQTEDTLNPDELAQIWARRAFELAQEPSVDASGQTVDLLVFKLGNEQYGVNVTNVREIYPLEKLTPVPRTPSFVAGVFSARGRILSVIDFGVFLGLQNPGNNRAVGQIKIIVVNNSPQSTQSGIEIGILADEVSDVITIHKTEIEPPLTSHAGTRTDYVEGVTANMLVVLNLDALLADERLIVLEEII